MMFLVARAKREHEHIVQRVSHTQKVCVALGDGHLGEGHLPKIPKMDEGEKAAMGMC